jgi:dolichyl-diphosphooligosaccharide--protein glycosyltransferase
LRSSSSRLPGLLLCLVVLAGVAARCMNWRSVLMPGGVELLPADSHYYVRFALLQLDAFPRFVTFDPWVNHPSGVHVIWPPVHTWAVTLAVALAGKARAVLGAAWVGPALSLVHLSLAALLLRRVRGGTAALVGTGMLALAPVAVVSGALGNADHHVHEPFLVLAAVLLGGAWLERPSKRAGYVCGALMVLARLLTTSGFLLTPLLALSAAVALWWRPSRELARSVAVAGGVATVGLFGASLLWGPGEGLHYEALTPFHGLLALGSFAMALAVWALRERRRRLLGFTLAVALVPVAFLLPEALRAAGHLGRSDPLLAVVMESEPLWSAPGWALELFGPVLVLLPVALFVTASQVLRDRQVERVPALVLTGAFLVAAALQVRFAQGLIGAAAALVGMQVALSLEQVREPRRLGLGVGLLMLPLLLGLRPLPSEPPPPHITKVRPSLFWLRDQPRRAHTEGVLADHQLGHFINLWAERPAVASLFSQLPEHVEANRKAVATLHARTEEEAVEEARALEVRWFLVTPASQVLGGRPSQDDVAAWLHEDAGLETPTREAAARLRLMHESEARRGNAPDKPTVRIFELVKGAALFGKAPPGATVEARLTVFGRPYVRRVQADVVGEFVFLVAYPSAEGYALRLVPKGTEGGVDACRDSGPARNTSVQVREEDVQRGLMVPLGTLAPCAPLQARESP